MPTLRQCFDSDFDRLLKKGKPVCLKNGERTIEIPVSVHCDFEANTTFLSCFVPSSPIGCGALGVVMDGFDEFLSDSNGVEVKLGFGSQRPINSKSLRFSGRVFIYHEDVFDDVFCDHLNSKAHAANLSLQFRGPTYAEEKNAVSKPIAFISHDSRDKDLIARPLAHELQQLMCPVWYDEFSLRIGDSLRDSIEKGIKECTKCILILSKTFLANQGWTKAEFNAVFSKELVEGKNAVLPIWAGIDKNELYEYSPTLVDRFGIQWKLGIKEVVRKIHIAVR